MYPLLYIVALADVTKGYQMSFFRDSSPPSFQWLKFEFLSMSQYSAFLNAWSQKFLINYYLRPAMNSEFQLQKADK